MIKYNYLATITLVISLISSAHASAFAAEEKALELGVKKMSFGYQSDIISALYDHEIPFYIDNEGILKYSGKYAEKVKKLIDDINQRPEMQFKDFKIASLFVLVLKQHNVDFLIRQGCNDMQTHIVYQRKDSQLVDKYVYPEFENALIKARKMGVYKIPKNSSGE